MSQINVLHDVKNLSISNGKKTNYEEYFIQGEKGLKIKYYNKENDKIEKIVITGSGDLYTMKTTINKEEPVETSMNKKEMMAELKSNKKLSFAISLMKGVKESSGGSVKRGSKKSNASK